MKWGIVMFYERFLHLCETAKITPSAAATKAGFSRGTVSVWKKKYEAGQDVVPEQDVINKICAFFRCTESWLRGIQEQKPATKGDELKIGPAYLSLAREMQANGIHPDDVKAILEVLERQKNDKG